MAVFRRGCSKVRSGGGELIQGVLSVSEAAPRIFELYVASPGMVKGGSLMIDPGYERSTRSRSIPLKEMPVEVLH